MQHGRQQTKLEVRFFYYILLGSIWKGFGQLEKEYKDLLS